MTNERETVREVCAEMKFDIVHEPEWFADRILAAYKREIAAKDAEIARMKAALKPVLECATLRCDQSEHDDMPAFSTIVRCHKAVRECQRLMKEGANND